MRSAGQHASTPIQDGNKWETLQDALVKARLATNAQIKRAENIRAREHERAERQQQLEDCVRTLPEQFRESVEVGIKKKPHLFNLANITKLAFAHRQSKMLGAPSPALFDPTVVEMMSNIILFKISRPQSFAHPIELS
jgi:hypothetical protein